MRAIDKNIDESLKEQLISDYRTADIPDFDKVMLDFAEKITRAPASINSEYIGQLREQGFDDQMLHDVVQVAAYYNYVNRLADALGVELEERKK